MGGIDGRKEFLALALALLLLFIDGVLWRLRDSGVVVVEEEEE